MGTQWRLCAALAVACAVSWLLVSAAVAWLEDLAPAGSGPSVPPPEPAPREVSALLEEARRITRDAAEG